MTKPRKCVQMKHRSSGTHCLLCFYRLHGRMNDVNKKESISLFSLISILFSSRSKSFTGSWWKQIIDFCSNNANTFWNWPIPKSFRTSECDVTHNFLIEIRMNLRLFHFILYFHLVVVVVADVSHKLDQIHWA